MKTILMLLTTTLFAAAPLCYAHAEDADDVFLDDGGVVDEASDEPDATEQAAPDTATTDDLNLDEPSDEEPVPMPDPEMKPAKAIPAPKTVKAVPNPAPKHHPKHHKEKKVAHAKPKPTRKTAATRDGFRVVSNDCEMHKSASSKSPVLLTVKASRKLWVEEHNGNWVKAFRKNGHGFLSRSCFE